MLEPRRSLSCFASTIATFFFIINVTLLGCAGMFGGFGIFFWIQPNHPISLGMEDIRLVLVTVAGCLAILSLLGMLAISEDSRWMTKLYSFLLILVMILQSVAGVYLMMIPSNMTNRIQSAWNRLSPESRNLTELRLICCGINSVSDSPKCTASKSVTCGPVIQQYQLGILNLLATTSFVFAAVELICLIIAKYLAFEFKKLKRKSLMNKPISVNVVENNAKRHVLPPSFRDSLPPPHPPPITQNGAKSMRNPRNNT